VSREPDSDRRAPIEVPALDLAKLSWRSTWRSRWAALVAISITSGLLRGVLGLSQILLATDGRPCAKVRDIQS